MFEGIRSIEGDSGMTIAVYLDGDVYGNVSFTSNEKATRVRSSYGPIGSTRECLASHWCGFRNRYKARIEDEVHCYA